MKTYCLFEKPLLEEVLLVVRGNSTRAAAILGLNRGTLRKKWKAHGLNEVRSSWKFKISVKSEADIQVCRSLLNNLVMYSQICLSWQIPAVYKFFLMVSGSLFEDHDLAV